MADEISPVMATSPMDITHSVGIGDDLRVYGSRAAINRVQELYGRRDRTLDAGLQRNSGREPARSDLGAERMNIGRRGVDETLTVTGNSDAMCRMQQIYLADSRRRPAAVRAGFTLPQQARAQG